MAVPTSAGRRPKVGWPATAGPALTLPKTRRTAHVGRWRHTGPTSARVPCRGLGRGGGVLSSLLDVAQRMCSVPWGGEKGGAPRGLGGRRPGGFRGPPLQPEHQAWQQPTARASVMGEEARGGPWGLSPRPGPVSTPHPQSRAPTRVGSGGPTPDGPQTPDGGVGGPRLSHSPRSRVPSWGAAPGPRVTTSQTVTAACDDLRHRERRILSCPPGTCGWAIHPASAAPLAEEEVMDGGEDGPASSRVRTHLQKRGAHPQHPGWLPLGRPLPGTCHLSRAAYKPPRGPARQGPASSVPSPALPHLFPKASQHPFCRQSPRSQLLGPPFPTSAQATEPWPCSQPG